jgi:UDP-glucose 4-epimerase
VQYVKEDIRSPALRELMLEHTVDVVVHLAAVVTPGRKSDRALEYSVDVDGTRNVLEASVSAGVRRLVVSSSGAAYGYHADNPRWLVETDAIRGNEEFAYAHHKRLVEEMLARYRIEHPTLEQLIFRPGTILGETTHNQITAIFDKPVVTGVAGSDSPFVLIWDEDVVGCIAKGIREQRTGIFNLAGDGVLTLREIAKLLGKPYVALPVGGIRSALKVMKKLGASQYGPEHVSFLLYRPVLCNRALKEDFGYIPRKTTREVFDLFLQERARTRPS